MSKLNFEEILIRERGFSEEEGEVKRLSTALKAEVIRKLKEKVEEYKLEALKLNKTLKPLFDPNCCIDIPEDSRRAKEVDGAIKAFQFLISELEGGEK